jgi:hypothetical protein
MGKNKPEIIPKSSLQRQNWERAILMAKEFLGYKLEDRVQAYYALQTKEE